MKKISTKIDGVYKITPEVFSDDRGFFVETYRRQWFPEGREVIQGNRADRQKGFSCWISLPFAPSRFLVCTIWSLQSNIT